jgi:hypothetical protein
VAEPPLTAKQRRWLDDADGGMYPPFKAAIVAALARLDWLEAELASLAPLKDLLSDAHADSLQRDLIEIGRARARQEMADEIGAWFVAHPGAEVPSIFLQMIRTSGPCLPAPPEEGEVERLRTAAAALVKAVEALDFRPKSLRRLRPAAPLAHRTTAAELLAVCEAVETVRELLGPKTE